ncbi:hypothetical protein C8034_v003620 [Colletotrichum sidae]|uniref:Secreted protein n=2 Tax=Colletotrichum orbiculare species complex TaxID=2707354 RepID=A0A4R8QJC8_9PEZI|nr:hypothetical protein C8035_v005640 [Colletotrichum spinosum]TEA21660.1 hypothetical protein C8034_v003620 [Colletotrichum sidae]
MKIAGFLLLFQSSAALAALAFNNPTCKAPSYNGPNNCNSVDQSNCKLICTTKRDACPNGTRKNWAAYANSNQQCDCYCW